MWAARGRADASSRRPGSAGCTGRRELRREPGLVLQDERSIAGNSSLIPALGVSSMALAIPHARRRAHPKGCRAGPGRRKGSRPRSRLEPIPDLAVIDVGGGARRRSSGTPRPGPLRREMNCRLLAGIGSLGASVSIRSSTSGAFRHARAGGVSKGRRTPRRTGDRRRPPGRKWAPWRRRPPPCAQAFCDDEPRFRRGTALQKRDRARFLDAVDVGLSQNPTHLVIKVLQARDHEMTS